MTDTGLECMKSSYYRSMGSGMVCGKDQEYDSLGLCYPACEGEWVGVGPACFSKCPVTHEPCAGVFCLPPGESCRGNVFNKVKDVAQTLIHTLIPDPSVFIDIASLYQDFNYEMCPLPKDA